jgi:hypothetical protein
MATVRSQTVHKLALADSVVTFYAQSDRDQVNVVVVTEGRKQPYQAFRREAAREVYRALLAKGYVDPTRPQPVPAPVAAKPKRQRRKATPAEAAAL